MSTALDIMRRALRAIGVLKAGKEPTGPDAQDALEHLQSVILGLPGFFHNGRWCEAAIDSAYTARESERITVTTPGVVTLPTVITCNTVSRPPYDLAKVQIIGADAENAGLWLFSATKGAWGQADALSTSSELPFGPEDDAGLAALLAVDMAAEFGGEAELGQRTVAVAQAAARSFRSRFKKNQPIDWTRPEPLGVYDTVGPYFRDYY